ncbi:hypothetical protein E9993_01925 [Labilibacter sediminis]|nr:hypothetical protein E9993_01925 [Labilibacter sediminis]
MRIIKYILLLTVFASCSSKQSADTSAFNLESAYWWPQQKAPSVILEFKESSDYNENTLIYSLAGLMARGVNEGETDKMIWMQTSNRNYEKWYEGLQSRLKVQVQGEYNAEELLVECMSEIDIKGYVLFKKPQSFDWNIYNESEDESYNVACMYAGVLGAVTIEEGLEEIAKKAGLKMLKDARDISSNACFRELKDQLDNNSVMTMHPARPNIRDYAVAHKTPIGFGVNDFVSKILEWTKPGSPLLGWNIGGESEFVIPATVYGIINTASNWCQNSLILSSNSINEELPRFKSLDPSTIDYEKGNHFHSFLMSDGDNMQWTMGSFVLSNDYWASPYLSSVPVSFTSCPLNISMMAPDAYKAMVKSQKDGISVVEYGGGYQYPDLFATNRGDEAPQISRDFVKKVNVHMKRTGTKVFGFLVHDLDSKAALDAYQIYAEELEDIAGIIAVQYAPYQGGLGDVYWFKNKKGIEIPVVTAKYSMWKDLKMMEDYAGNPKTLPAKINRDVEKDKAEGKKSFSWTAVHAWSKFHNPAYPNNPDELAAGVAPVKWTTEKMLQDINVVSIEELLWRIRMQHNPEQTKALIYN